MNRQHLAPLALIWLPAALLLAACESRSIGRPCLALPGAADAGDAHTGTVINDQALECRPTLCVQQVPDPTTAHDVDTQALCTADCRRDADCDDGDLRDPTRAGDRRCRSGFYCGIPLTTGTVAPCRRLCLCRDFLGGAPPEIPPACAGRP